MVKIEKTIIVDGAHHKQGFKSVNKEGNTPKDRVRYHIDQEVGDVYDLVADLSKMIWLLNRKIEGKTLPEDVELEAKLMSRTADVDNIIAKYYDK